jgi:hypothetical protein
LNPWSGPQLRVLLWRKIQPDSAHAFAERLLNLLPTSDIRGEAAAFRYLPNLPISSEGQRSRQRRLHVIFEN